MCVCKVFLGNSLSQKHVLLKTTDKVIFNRILLIFFSYCLARLPKFGYILCKNSPKFFSWTLSTIIGHFQGYNHDVIFFFKILLSIRIDWREIRQILYIKSTSLFDNISSILLSFFLSTDSFHHPSLSLFQSPFQTFSPHPGRCFKIREILKTLWNKNHSWSSQGNWSIFQEKWILWESFLSWPWQRPF